MHAVVKLVKRFDKPRVVFEKISRGFHKIRHQASERADCHMELEGGVGFGLHHPPHNAGGDRQVHQFEQKGVNTFAFAAGQAGAHVPVPDPVFNVMRGEGERDIEEGVGEFRGDKCSGGRMRNRQHDCKSITERPLLY